MLDQYSADQRKVYDEVVRQLIEMGVPSSDPRIAQVMRDHASQRHILAIKPVVERIVSTFWSTDEPVAYGPQINVEHASTGSDAMEVVPYEESAVTKPTKLAVEEEKQLNKAIEASYADRQQTQEEVVATEEVYENPEDILRDPSLIPGIANSGNSCWFNCIAQMLYAIPKFRSLVYHCVPCTWERIPILNVEFKHRHHAELLFKLRTFFATFQFTEKKYVNAADIIKTIEKLFESEQKYGQRGIQQDASEMFLKIMEWLEMGFHAAIFAHKHPNYSHRIDDNFVVIESTGSAPNSDVRGAAPPYSPHLEGPSTSSAFRTPKSRTNSPQKSCTPSSSSRKLESIDESMDTSESPTSPEVPKTPRKMTADVNPDVEKFVEDLDRQFGDLFAAVRKTYNKDGTPTDRSHPSVPDILTLNLEQDNLHDGIEDCFSSINGSFDLYTRLPNVLFVTLSRYKNSATTFEKINRRFTFPSVLFMDRYSEDKSDVILALRKQLSEYRHTLSTIRAQMKGLEEYPQGDGFTNVVSAFNTVVEVVNVHRKSDPPHTANKNSHSHLIEDYGKLYPNFSQAPEELQSLSAKLQELLSELKGQAVFYEQEEKRLTHLINESYNIDSLTTHKYDLHAVILHDGHVEHGHYLTFKWKYFKDGGHEWQRISDCEAIRSDLAQLENESFGSEESTKSAYVLMYLKSDCEWLTAQETLSEDDAHQNLPGDLQDLVSTQRRAFRAELDRYRMERERKLRALQAAETPTGDFSWYTRGEIGDADSKKGKKRHSRCSGPLDSHEMTILENDEHAELDNRTQFLWRLICLIAPNRYETMDNLLNTQLERLMEGDLGGRSYIEQNINCKIEDVRRDAENDVEKGYKKFLEGFLKTMKPARDDDHNIREFLQVYVYSEMHHLNVPLLHYLLVRTLAISNSLGAFQERAKLDVKLFVANGSEKLQTMARISQFVSCIFEVGVLMIWSTRIAFENCRLLYHGIITEHSHQLEALYHALIASKYARVCARIVYDNTSFMGRRPVMFVNPDYIEWVTLMTAVAMSKMFIKHIALPSYGLASLEFYLRKSERRVTVLELLTETKHALNYMRSALIQADQTGHETLADLLTKVTKLLADKFLAVSNLKHLSDDESLCIRELLNAVMTEQEGREQLTHLIECKAETGKPEIENLLKLSYFYEATEENVLNALASCDNFITSQIR